MHMSFPLFPKNPSDLASRCCGFLTSPVCSLGAGSLRLQYSYMYTLYLDHIDSDHIEYPQLSLHIPLCFHVLLHHHCFHLFIPSPIHNLLSLISATHICIGVEHPLKYEQPISSHTPQRKMTLSQKP